MSTLTTPGPPQLGAGPPGGPFDKYAWRRAVVLLHLGLVALIVVYVIHGRPATDGSAGAVQDVAGTQQTPARADARGLDLAARPTPTPDVPDVVRADFTRGDGWPAGAVSRDTGAVSTPMGLVARALAHGAATGPGIATSWMEQTLPAAVRAIGARVRFAPERSGAVALTAWQTTVLGTTSAHLAGMRLVATPGHWHLEVIDTDGTATLASGSYDRASLTASFGLVRSGADVWVTDPTGRVTRASDPRAATLTGPFASWELRDNGAGSEPAVIEAVWAG